MARDSITKALKYMGLEGGKPLLGHAYRRGLHRKLHQRAHLRSAHRRGRAQGPQGERQGARAGGARVAGSQAPGHRRGAAGDLPRRRLRMARARLLHVHRHERRPAFARPVQRFHQQPQFRRPAGQGRAHVPGQPADRRRQRHHRRGYRREDTAMKPFTNFESRMVPLPMNNVDTDQIIPARFLKTTSKQGLDRQLFNDWRYDAAGQSQPGFRPEPAAGAGRAGAAGGRQFRLRQLARARTLGAHAVRLPRRRQHVLRRYLQAEFVEECATAGCSPRGVACGVVPGGRRPGSHR